MLRAASGPLSAHSGLTSSLVSVWTFDSKLPKWVRRLLIARPPCICAWYVERTHLR
jgi:hypothetical protein